MSQMPPRMHRYRRELEAAIAADRRRTRRRRLGGVAAVLAAVVVVLNLLPSGGERRLPAAVEPANAVERATQALEPPRGTILHVHMKGRQFENGRPDIRWSHETWVRVGEEAVRTVQEQPGGVVAETAMDGRTDMLWDAENGRVLQRTIPPEEPTAGGTGDEFRAEILELLRSGQAAVTGRREVGGRAALEITGDDRSRSFLVDAESYVPIELRTRGTSGGTVLRFVAYETLPLDDETESLLSISAQHGDAPVVKDAAAFQELAATLFANG
jgi:hypothetical protein